jgi:ATP-binding cassette subfamily B protein
MAEKETQKKETFPNSSAMLSRFLRHSWIFYVLCVLSSAVNSLLEMINPKLISFTVDSIIGDTPTALPWYLSWFSTHTAFLKEHLWYMALAVLGIAFLASLARYFFRLCNAIGSARLVQTMHDDLYAHLMRLPFSWYQKYRTGDIIQRSTSDVDTVQRFVSEQLVSLVRIVIMITLAEYYMFRINVRMGWIAFLFVPVIILYSYYFHKKISGSFLQADEAEGLLSSIVQENLTGVRVVRAFGRERYEQERFEKQNKFYTEFWFKLMKYLAAFWSSGDLVSYLQVLVILVMGSVYCVRGTISAGSFIAFLTYNAMLAWPVRSLGRVISSLSRAGISMERIREIMNAEEEKDIPGAQRPPMDQDIDFDHVSYAYAGAQEEVLQDVTFHVPAGSTVGILGGTGSGKSTLMLLLDRLYPLSEGSIRIGGVDIRQIDMSYLRSQVGMVLQEPYLFSRSLEDNIRIARPSADRREVRSAARTASLDETVQSFHEGYDTFVGERGVTLSGGQKQRTAIAQMLIRKPPIMVFDDSLSAVDAETDARIRHQLKKETGSRTVFLISHRISTLMEADEIIVLDHGRLAEQGTHEQLLARNGIYRRIYDLQVNAGKEDV